MRNDRIAFYLLLVLLPVQCIDPYEPEWKDSENLLVIEGTITNAPGPYTVKISTTPGLESSLQKPLEGASVVLSEQGGTQEFLEEIAPGTYSTSVAGIQGVVGHSYKISVTTPDGQAYESSYETILPPEPIDTVYAVVESRSDPKYAYDLQGYQFYLETTIQNEGNAYFLWKLTETYKLNSDLLIPYYYAGHIYPFPDPDSLFTCYKTTEIQDILAFDASRLEIPRIQGYPLRYVDTEGRDLYLRYSLLTRQYSISKEAYVFWNNIQKQNTGFGALYTTQPFQIRGNMVNIQDPGEAVLGYFMAAGYTEKRIFVDPPSGVAFHFSICTIGDYEILYMQTLPRTWPSRWPIYLSTSPEGILGVPAPICVDCRLRGASLERPDFWVD